MNWMDPRLRGTDAYHPYALTSYLFFRGQPFQWEPDEFVFGDSGGYSVAERGAVIEPRAAVRWQLRFCNVGVILDTPPGADREFSDCLARTVAATKGALTYYLRALDAGTSFRWWGVVHGRTTPELAEWWEAVRRVYPFEAEGEGWAFKPKPLNDPEAVADTLDFIRERKMRRAHLFGCSGQLMVETLLCLGPGAGLEFVTFDSTSPITRGVNRVLLIPSAYGWKQIRERNGETPARDYMRSICACPSCALLRRDLSEDGELIDDGYWRERMVFHNVLVMLQRFRQLELRYAPARDALLGRIGAARCEPLAQWP